MEAEYFMCIVNNHLDANFTTFHVKFYYGVELGDVKAVAETDDSKILRSVSSIIVEKHQ